MISTGENGQPFIHLYFHYPHVIIREGWVVLLSSCWTQDDHGSRRYFLQPIRAYLVNRWLMRGGVRLVADKISLVQTR